ncbi:hypothetical protein D1007_48694 [Hordeum vulgare]|nr:hypothetical protein D1007_48694 [Hordeum vulgare]
MVRTAWDLKYWSKSFFRQAKMQFHLAAEIVLRLDVAQERRCLSAAEFTLRKLLKLRLLGFAALEGARRRQASRLTWLRLGDAGTKFFHAKATTRKRKKFIHCLRVGDDVLTAHDHKEEAIHNHFQLSMGSRAARPLQVDWSIFDLPSVRNRGLDNPFSEKEMKNIMNIHYVDKEAFMNVDIVDKYEEVLIFLESPSYDEVVEETPTRLKWVDASDQVELVERYDVGSAQESRMKTTPIRSNLHWVAYKEVVASSMINSLELFASKVVKAPLFQVELNQTLVDDVEHKIEVQDNEYSQYEFRGSAPINDDDHDSEEEYERQHNNVGDVEAQVRHEDMDPDIIYQRACVDDSGDEGPVNELEEDGFTEKEPEWYI